MSFSYTPSNDCIPITTAPIDKLVLLYFDGPHMVLADSGGVQVIGVSIDEDSNGMQWLFVQASPYQMVKLLKNQIDLNILFSYSSNTELHYFTKSHIWIKGFKVSIKDIPEHFIPSGSLPELEDSVFKNLLATQEAYDKIGQAIYEGIFKARQLNCLPKALK